ncbi:MAG TPA: carbonic anhydrase family protein [Thermoanaerobaculia bacterium]|nr:carbonic anhydrase family protein [Thermoanaerobaculia bacterium]
MLISLVAAVPALADDAACATAWGYDGTKGPDFWGQLASEWQLCDSGKAQSPIRLQGMERAALPEVQLHYPPSLPYTLQHTSHELKVYPLLDARITYGGNPAELLQFHVHTPAEHRFPDQPQAPAEIHFVHRQSNGKLLVLGVLVVEGAANAQLQKMIEARPPSVCQSNKPAEPLALSELLPSPNHYATYEGSLTTPPCDQGVTWVVLLRPIEATRAQLDALKVVANDRGVQPLAGRKVRWRG